MSDSEEEFAVKLISKLAYSTGAGKITWETTKPAQVIDGSNQSQSNEPTMYSTSLDGFRIYLFSDEIKIQEGIQSIAEIKNFSGIETLFEAVESKFRPKADFSAARERLLNSNAF